MRVRAVGEELPAAPQRAIDSAGEPDGEPLYPPGERVPVLRLDDQVQVIALHRVMGEAGAEPLAPGDDPRGRQSAADTKQAPGPGAKLL